MRVFASVRLTIVLLSITALTVLIGAWCPQEAQGGQEKVLEQFGLEWGTRFIQWGISDIFHTPFFLALIGLITVNMVACSVQRVFPRVRLLRLPLPWLGEREIGRLPYHDSAYLAAEAGTTLALLAKQLRRRGYRVNMKENRLVAEFGKFGRLAATITHIGLLTLLLGVTITSWTGFSGFKPVCPGQFLAFQDSEHSKLWIGRLPDWKVRVESTRREDYTTGDAKQWYSDLTVVDPSGKELARQTISVNNPLSYQGVDVYQSSWGMDHLLVKFNEHQIKLPLRPMGKLYAAFVPLDETTVLILSVRDQVKPLRLFAKVPAWPAPKLLAELAPGKGTNMGGVEVQYEKAVAVTGLQYKCDPGLPITYVAFAFIISGVMLAAIPHRQVWAVVESAGATDIGAQVICLSAGGRSVKAKTGFERSMKAMMETMKSSCRLAQIEDNAANTMPAVSGTADQSVKLFTLVQPAMPREG